MYSLLWHTKLVPKRKYLIYRKFSFQVNEFIEKNNPQESDILVVVNDGIDYQNRLKNKEKLVHGDMLHEMFCDIEFKKQPLKTSL